PVALEGKVAAAAASGAIDLRIEALTRCSDGDFFPEREGVFTHARIRRIGAGEGGLRFTLALREQPPDALTRYAACVEQGASTRAFLVSTRVTRVAPVVAGGSALSLGVALAFAFLGGLALNLMPCVFPVLALKVLGIANLSGRARALRVRHAGAFT